MFGAGLYETYKAFTCDPVADAAEGCGTGYGLPETAVATVVAFGVGLAVIAFLMNYIKRSLPAVRDLPRSCSASC